MSKDSSPDRSIDEPKNRRQFLTFCLNNEYFGMELHQTREILEYSDVTDVPLMPGFMSGVINLRGEVVPVIDLAIRLGRDPIKLHKRTCIVIIELHSYEQKHVLGLLVDSVSEVVELDTSDVEEAPAFGANIRAEFILGIAKKEEQFVILLDAEKTLSPIELASLVEAEFQATED
ncbi:chemotaxis signal transduction protein CheW [Oleiphilus messinensis]|uniref:Chemotaxis signal transduction protein CheW n=1 Tax=Oleiphilus messinensis TaxID=141451 RepID=A0A1Y0I9K7_9GAMM|nr:chemotaxis protein CheW [Oleiphilus messinensis]ARU56920.1 chemotaxis signal transduction protein CheW [Oleiphilus messinensis]